jgi:hypothetical protein
MTAHHAATTRIYAVFAQISPLYPPAVILYSARMRDLEIKKLSDEFGQYTLILKCGSCLRERHCTPHLLAKLCGWDTKLEDVARRMRCSVCGKKKCTARAVPMTPPRGYKSH